ncbi:transposase [Candidatus Tisiphia endosymbiont of Parasteatoda lunata]|uniref:transposase n=1 Tax=Candidatus Tisiphia endosymbiont of Parasteatoda lunata TaxID=3066275 RepID=UPI00313CD93E
MSQHKKNISVKCKILLKNICMIHSYLFLIRYLKFMLKRRTASAGFFSQSGTINWSSLEEWLSANVDIKKFGRNRRCHRLLLGVTMLQAMYNLSDAATEEELRENVYWQYFCGWEYLQKDAEISEASIRRFRTILGEDGYNEILKELIRIGCKAGVVKKKT